jgi:hypothetical protein
MQIGLQAPLGNKPIAPHLMEPGSGERSWCNNIQARKAVQILSHNFRISIGGWLDLYAGAAPPHLNEK